jgi:hypothetical protein
MNNKQLFLQEYEQLCRKYGLELMVTGEIDDSNLYLSELEPKHDIWEIKLDD